MSAAVSTPWAAAAAGRWHRGLLFGRMHEDAAVDEAALGDADRVFAVASAGDTALRLAGAGRDVTAVDVHPAQVAYVRHRAAGGPPRRGRVDRLLAGARLAGAAAGCGRPELCAFLLLDDPAAQAAAWERLTGTRRCRALLAAGFSPAVLPLAYAAPFRSLLPRPFGERLCARLRAGFATHPNRDNPYAWRLLLDEDPPGGGEPRRAVVGRLAVEQADAVAFLEAQAPGSLDGFTLSNILDGPDEAYARRLAGAVRRAGRPDAPVVVRTFRDPRNDDEAGWARRDRGLIWGAIVVTTAGDLPGRVGWSR
jgi:Protein of unknown function (DUF3419)